MPPAQREAQTAGPANVADVPTSMLPLFRRRLLAWFRRNQRDLAWRRTRDSYRIWVSEIMLQQTRVATVTPYYDRFLKLFPSVEHLARARRETLLRAWAGLGYYSRARNLHQAARLIVASHGGLFPRSPQHALALPGVGRYTTAAVLSIAYGRPLAVLDGNVARVLARLGAVHGELRQPMVWRRLQETADALLARRAPGDWNQAVMELGATVCTPQTPRCSECPVARWCRARVLGLAERLPAGRRKNRAVKLTVAAAVLFDPQGRTLLVRHPDRNGALFSNLWQFPAVEAPDDAHEALAARLRQDLRLNAALQRLPAARHTVTFRDLQLVPFLVRVRRLPSLKGARTPELAALARMAVSSATRKIAAAALRAV